MSVKSIAFAVLLSVAMPTMVFAQAEVSPGGNAAPNAAQNPDAGGQAGGYQDFDAFLQGFGNADFATAMASLETMGEEASFTVVSVGELANADPERLQTALQAHDEDLTALRAALMENQEAVAALEDEGLTPEHVVWIESGADQTIVLYVSDLDRM